MITSSLEVALFILTIEFALIAIAITFYSYRGARAVEAENTADATELVSKVAETEESRRSALETIFKVKYQYEGDELTAMVDEFMQREKAFYNAVVGAFLGRDKNKLSDLNDELTKVVAPWISMTPKNMVDSKEAASLAATNSRLEMELVETKEVLEQMIEEYNRTFHTEKPMKDTGSTQQDTPVEDATEEIEETVAAESEDAVENTDADVTEVETSDLTTETLDQLIEPNELEADAEASVEQSLEK